MKDTKSLIADTIHGSIMLSGFEKKIMTTTLFNRLHGICQNSTAYLTFPTNRTRRLEHSFGCMFLCGEIFYSSICNTEEKLLDEFFGIVRHEIKEIIKEVMESDVGKAYEHKVGKRFLNFHKQYEELSIMGGLFNYKTPANIKETDRKDYILIFEGIRIAALLHDIGHPPFSHISENALNVIYKNIEKKEKRTIAEQEFWDILNGKVGDDHQLHEELGLMIAKGLLLSAIDDLRDDQANNKEIYEKQVYKILVAEIALRIMTNKTCFLMGLHSIIDGTLDGDRLDYVSRDPINSGFDLGKIEYDRITSKMKLCKSNNSFLFCPSVSNVKAVEDFLIRRWNLYKNIVYHHRVVKTDYMLQNVIIEIAKKYFEEHANDKETDMDYILPYDISGLWKANKKRPSDQEMIYAISQWDDIWLLTILKKYYFGTYINESGTLSNQLEELLTNKKHYYSLVKRKEEFEQIDKKVAEVIVRNSDEIKKIISELEEIAKCQVAEKSSVDISGFLKKINETINHSIDIIKGSTNTYNGFVLCKIKKTLFLVDSFSEILDAVLKKMDRTKDDMFYSIKELKTGTSKSLHFYREDGSLVALNQLSNIEKVLREEEKFSPFLFFYLSYEKGKKLEFKEEREKIGRAIGECIVEFIKNRLIEFKNNIEEKLEDKKS